jgi:hypothetical protein
LHRFTRLGGLFTHKTFRTITRVYVATPTMMDNGIEPSSPAEVFVEDQRTTKLLVKLLRHTLIFTSFVRAQEHASLFL